MAAEIERTVGHDVAVAISQLLEHAATPQGYTIATVLGVVVLLFGASGVFVQLQDSLDTIWKVVPKPRRGGLRVVSTENAMRRPAPAAPALPGLPLPSRG